MLRRIAELGREVAGGYPDEPPLMVAVVEGARVFARELLRWLPAGWKVEEIRAASYGEGTESSGSVRVVGGEGLEVVGRRVLLVEDIVDTGYTVARLEEWFRARGAVEVDVVTLLTKPARRVVDVGVGYVGFEIEDRFVIGFGMDVGGRYRELPYVAVYE